MKKGNKFIDEAMAEVDAMAENNDDVFSIKLSSEQVEIAKKLQETLGLSKDLFFNVLAKYGAYCCDQTVFDRESFPEIMSDISISFSLSAESETALNKHDDLSGELIVVFGLNEMARKLL